MGCDARHFAIELRASLTPDAIELNENKSWRDLAECLIRAATPLNPKLKPNKSSILELHSSAVYKIPHS